MGKDQYYDSVEGMINGRILPWVQDSESENYSIWSDFGASQRDVYFLDYGKWWEGTILTVVSLLLLVVFSISVDKPLN